MSKAIHIHKTWRPLHIFKIGSCAESDFGPLYLSHHGGVAQLGERLTGSQEVRGSIPLVSTLGILRASTSVGALFVTALGGSNPVRGAERVNGTAVRRAAREAARAAEAGAVAQATADPPRLHPRISKSLHLGRGSFRYRPRWIEPRSGRGRDRKPGRKHLTRAQVRPNRQPAHSVNGKVFVRANGVCYASSRQESGRACSWRP